MKTNEAGINLIKKWEGLRTEAYLCPAKVWTIGYGHTSAAGAPAVKKGMKITAKEADDILRRDLSVYEKAVKDAVKVPLSANKFASLVSFTYNLGAGNLRKSTLLKKLNAGDYDGAANEFAKWNKANGKVLKGLVDRRAEEKALFLSSDASKPATSSSSVSGLLSIILKLLGIKR